MDDATTLRSPTPIADVCQTQREVRATGLDEVDLDALVASHGAEVTRLVARLVDRREDVDDLVQETFLAAIASRRTFRGQCRPGTWLARIAMNRCRSYHRRRRVRRYLPLLPRHGSDDSKAVGPQATFETDEEVRRAVGRLSGEYREAIVLRYFEDLSIDEMTQVLGVRRTTVEKRLSRGRQKLKKILTPRLERR